MLPAGGQRRRRDAPLERPAQDQQGGRRRLPVGVDGLPASTAQTIAGGWGDVPNQDVIIDFWTRFNKTKTKEVVKISSKTTAHFYKDGINDNEVWHHKIKGLGHSVPGKRDTGINAVEVIWDFFSKFY